MRGKSARLAAGGHHPVARNDESDGVPSQRLSHGLGFAGLTNALGDLTIRPHLSRWDCASGLVYLSREGIRSRQVHDDVAEILGLTSEVLA
jgi:hypothetical protein